MGFKKAERRHVKLKLGISGPSGSGKTFTALRIAKGLLAPVKGDTFKIALIDTENRSASLYADTKGMPAFDALELEPPYTVDKYIAAMELALKENYDLLIVDSVSHVWSGEGGLLQEKEALDTRGGNSFANWAKMTPKWNRFVSAILHSDMHMICTMRSKQEHALSQNDKGKTEVKKLGMAPQVRDGFEYELTAVFDMGMDHQAMASKDRTNLFDGRVWRPDEKTGDEIWTWLSSGKAPEPPEAAPAPQPAASTAPPKAQAATKAWKATKEHLAALQKLAKTKKWTNEQVATFMDARFQKTKLSLFAETEYVELCNIVTALTFADALAKWESFKAAEAQRASEPAWGSDLPSHIGGGP